MTGGIHLSIQMKLLGQPQLKSCGKLAGEAKVPRMVVSFTLPVTAVHSTTNGN